MKAKTIKGKSTKQIESALHHALNEDHLQQFKPSLSIVFMSFRLDIDAVCELLNRYGIEIFGSTTHGEFINSEIEHESIVIMLLDINPHHFRLTYSEKGKLSEYEISKQLGEQGKSIFTNAAFIIATGWSNEMDGEEIIRGIEDGYGPDSLILGGMAGDDQTMTGPQIFTHGKSSTKGIAALIIDRDKIDVTGVATCGWKAIGITKTITKSIGNIVYTIDDKPALDVVMQYLGFNMDEELMKNMVLNLGGYYPLQLEREGAPSVMRTAMVGNLEDRSLVYAGNVPQGAKVRFSLPPDFDVIDTVVKECNDAKEQQLKDADAVIMFSCKSRHFSLGEMVSEEIQRVKDVWKAPMVGFFTNGEFGKSMGGTHEFHNNTCCVVAIKEKAT